MRLPARFSALALAGALLLVPVTAAPALAAPAAPAAEPLPPGRPPRPG